MRFACKICRPCTQATHWHLQVFSNNFNILERTSADWINRRRNTLDFVIGAVTKNAPLFALGSASKMPADMQTVGRIKVRRLPDWDRQ
jgi:hypothetical protein